MINKLAIEIHENAIAKGFYEKPTSVAEKLCLIHSEVSEALDADRSDEYCEVPNVRDLLNIEHDALFRVDFVTQVASTFEDELADIVIRVMDLAASRGIDLEAHILAKVRYNAMREHKHGKKY